MELNSKKIAVIGGAGLVGSHIVDQLIQEPVKEILIYEPQFDKKTFMGIKVISDLKEFKKNCDLIIANRVEDDLKDITNKIFTRDVFGNN